MKRMFYVWDALNGEPGDAKAIEASSPEEAACEYADNDWDGLTDGLYRDCSQPLIVVSDGGKEQWRVEVSAEMVPKMHAGTPKPLDETERFEVKDVRTWPRK